jgi:hypothetical protein
MRFTCNSIAIRLPHAINTSPYKYGQCPGHPHYLFAHNLSPQYKQRPEPMRLVGIETETEVETEANKGETEGIEAER